MKISKRNVILYIISFIILISIGTIAICNFKANSSLKKNLEVSKAVIIDKFFTIRYTKYFSYEFSVKEIVYQGTGKYYPESDLVIGDTISIVYDKSDPNNNKPIRDF